MEASSSDGILVFGRPRRPPQVAEFASSWPRRPPHAAEFAPSRRLQQGVSEAYAMMRSAHHFMDVFSGGDPLHGSELEVGDATSLKKAYHKLAMRLHPDRHQHSALGVQVQAEEIFKLVSSKYQQESDRLLSV